MSPPEVEGFEDLVEIGRGGFGIVYRARQPEFNRTVAIKILAGTLDDEARRRFDRERRAMGSLSTHPNIVTVYASGFTAQSSPYIVMEYVTGGSLADRLQQGPLPWREVADIGAKLCGALEAAHKIGMLHRDIKPENVLVSDYGEPKLADFGIARIKGAFETQSAILTSPLYAAPEVLNGKRPSEASDVYSLATTLFTLIDGRAPFMRDTDDSMLPVITRVLTEPPPDLRGRGIPEGMCSALEAAMEKEPAQRTESAAEFGRQLSVLAESSGRTRAVAAPPSPPGEEGRVPKPAGRRRVRPAAIAVAALIALGGGVAVATTQGGGGSHHRTTPTSTTIVPPIPARLAGFAKDGAPVTATQRVFAGQPVYLDNFPYTMNGCNDATTTTQWRSLVPDDLITAGPTDVHGSTTLQPSDVKGTTTGRAGIVRAGGCQEPVFFFASSPGNIDTLVDVAYTIQKWRAAP